MKQKSLRRLRPKTNKIYRVVEVAILFLRKLYGAVFPEHSLLRCLRTGTPAAPLSSVLSCPSGQEEMHILAAFLAGSTLHRPLR